MNIPKSFVDGAFGFAVVGAVLLFLGTGYKHYQLVSSLEKVVNNQCSVVEAQAVKALEQKIRDSVIAEYAAKIAEAEAKAKAEEAKPSGN